MFEDSLMESDHRIKAAGGYWSLVGFLCNCAVLIALIVWPLMHPEALPKQSIAALLVAPAPPPAIPSRPRAQSQPTMLHTNSLAAPSRIPTSIRPAQSVAAQPSLQGVVEALNSGDRSPLGSVIGDAGTGPIVVVQPAPTPRKMIISSGVMDGNLLQKTVPQYPAIARAARIQGTVVVQATISKAGLIENLRVISGPPMLQQAAIDAVRSWRYKPYLLNGDPVEVDTVVNIVFSLGQ